MRVGVSNATDCGHDTSYVPTAAKATDMGVGLSFVRVTHDRASGTSPFHSNRDPASFLVVAADRPVLRPRTR